jgi:hypothetical protein
MSQKAIRSASALGRACAIALLLAPLDAGAFTFSDGKSAICMAGGQSVEEVEADASQGTPGFTGKTVRTSSGFQIVWNSTKLKALPPEVHDYIFFHECAHARVPTQDEIRANCAGLQDMRAAGRAGAAVESSLGAFYGQGNAYWARTLECANAGALKAQ